MLILLTNDDGIHSEGLTVLRQDLIKTHDVCVVAPERERTCIGHAITLHKPLRIRELKEGIYATNGAPADCVYLAIKAILKRKPDMIISGINKGPNMGQDVHYSGTVAAAKEGAFLGITSMAVSICAREDFLFKDSALAVHEIIDIVKGKTLFTHSFLNANIPNIPYKETKGFMVTRLGKRIYNDEVLERVDPRGGKYYWIGGTSDAYEEIRGTDFYAVAKGYVSITPLGLDMTHIDSIKDYKTYFRRSS
ncbi:MAG TPA: 5'/3'-nucleotidase SurE [Syntrophorhabdaceae bacterium]|nr:5'/3'-nucleotidase SurE [Syntrophorhabdaceae bacterium]